MCCVERFGMMWTASALKQIKGISNYKAGSNNKVAERLVAESQMLLLMACEDDGTIAAT
jgi:hypothetical protein